MGRAWGCGQPKRNRYRDISISGNCQAGTPTRATPSSLPERMPSSHPARPRKQVGTRLGKKSHPETFAPRTSPEPHLAHNHSHPTHLHATIRIQARTCRRVRAPPAVGQGTRQPLSGGTPNTITYRIFAWPINSILAGWVWDDGAHRARSIRSGCVAFPREAGGRRQARRNLARLGLASAGAEGGFWRCGIVDAFSYWGEWGERRHEFG